MFVDQNHAQIRIKSGHIVKFPFRKVFPRSRNLQGTYQLILQSHLESFLNGVSTSIIVSPSSENSKWILGKSLEKSASVPHYSSSTSSKTSRSRSVSPSSSIPLSPASVTYNELFSPRAASPRRKEIIKSIHSKEEKSKSNVSASPSSSNFSFSAYDEIHRQSFSSSESSNESNKLPPSLSPLLPSSISDGALHYFASSLIRGAGSSSSFTRLRQGRTGPPTFRFSAVHILNDRLVDLFTGVQLHFSQVGRASSAKGSTTKPATASSFTQIAGLSEEQFTSIGQFDTLVQSALSNVPIRNGLFRTHISIRIIYDPTLPPTVQKTKGLGGSRSRTPSPGRNSAFSSSSSSSLSSSSVFTSLDSTSRSSLSSSFSGDPLRQSESASSSESTAAVAPQPIVFELIILAPHTIMSSAAPSPGPSQTVQTQKEDASIEKSLNILSQLCGCLTGRRISAHSWTTTATPLPALMKSPLFNASLLSIVTLAPQTLPDGERSPNGSAEKKAINEEGERESADGSFTEEDEIQAKPAKKSKDVVGGETEEQIIDTLTWVSDLTNMDPTFVPPPPSQIPEDFFGALVQPPEPSAEAERKQPSAAKKAGQAQKTKQKQKDASPQAGKAINPDGRRGERAPSVKTRRGQTQSVDRTQQQRHSDVEGVKKRSASIERSPSLQKKKKKEKENKRQANEEQEKVSQTPSPSSPGTEAERLEAMKNASVWKKLIAEREKADDDEVNVEEDIPNNTSEEVAMKSPFARLSIERERFNERVRPSDDPQVLQHVDDSATSPSSLIVSPPSSHRSNSPTQTSPQRSTQQTMRQSSPPSVERRRTSPSRRGRNQQIREKSNDPNTASETGSVSSVVMDFSSDFKKKPKKQKQFEPRKPKQMHRSHTESPPRQGQSALKRSSSVAASPHHQHKKSEPVIASGEANAPYQQESLQDNQYQQSNVQPSGDALSSSSSVPALVLSAVEAYNQILPQHTRSPKHSSVRSSPELVKRRNSLSNPSSSVVSSSPHTSSALSTPSTSLSHRGKPLTDREKSQPQEIADAQITSSSSSSSPHRVPSSAPDRYAHLIRIHPSVDLSPSQSQTSLRSSSEPLPSQSPSLQFVAATYSESAPLTATPIHSESDASIKQPTTISQSVFLSPFRLSKPPRHPFNESDVVASQPFPRHTHSRPHTRTSVNSRKLSSSLRSSSRSVFSSDSSQARDYGTRSLNSDVPSNSPSSTFLLHDLIEQIRNSTQSVLDEKLRKGEEDENALVRSLNSLSRIAGSIHNARLQAALACSRLEKEIAKREETEQNEQKEFDEWLFNAEERLNKVETQSNALSAIIVQQESFAKQKVKASTAIVADDTEKVRNQLTQQASKMRLSLLQARQQLSYRLKCQPPTLKQIQQSVKAKLGRQNAKVAALEQTLVLFRMQEGRQRERLEELRANEEEGKEMLVQLHQTIQEQHSSIEAMKAEFDQIARDQIDLNSALEQSIDSARQAARKTKMGSYSSSEKYSNAKDKEAIERQLEFITQLATPFSFTQDNSIGQVLNFISFITSVVNEKTLSRKAKIEESDDSDDDLYS
ncbi:uncharacterized protein MONOS_4995 [Monocercomonoides exilis]|uniref:uncharacterized protein n=1 Tax=Monocercomonoides exilis TaxID=2049356 RepID=UPI003559B777|nr:hypothetical protein MONOS_4995 [Monocercomonoides exilis]|eukprot:MONOS_4995.1-p1 / transcript=MONOS_4995.1 / gene=MONOS_4995 / organism=Monocercomonoides_exilis_PA203 / gene_product=unspecified product / transcript_product=unspecified product / location=Mono_scaffold00140:68923-73813(+) / protein_length=1558 / sequence_SO=supercontig / SO=protein_coding / is_pseudo=false